MLSPKCEIGNIVSKYPGNCTKCRINEILFCKDCSRRMAPSLDLVKIMDQFSKCNLCRSTIAFNKYCWEIQPCKHKMHEECFKKLSDYRRQITCLYCLHQR